MQHAIDQQLQLSEAGDTQQIPFETNFTSLSKDDPRHATTVISGNAVLLKTKAKIYSHKNGFSSGSLALCIISTGIFAILMAMKCAGTRNCVASDGKVILKRKL